MRLGNVPVRQRSARGQEGGLGGRGRRQVTDRSGRSGGPTGRGPLPGDSRSGGGTPNRPNRRPRWMMAKDARALRRLAAIARPRSSNVLPRGGGGAAWPDAHHARTGHRTSRRQCCHQIRAGASVCSVVGSIVNQTRQHIESRQQLQPSKRSGLQCRRSVLAATCHVHIITTPRAALWERPQCVIRYKLVRHSTTWHGTAQRPQVPFQLRRRRWQRP